MNYNKMLILVLVVLSGICLMGCEKDKPAQSLTTSPKDQVSHKIVSNSVGLKLVYIPSGEFMMGSRDSSKEVASRCDCDYPDNYTDDSFLNEHPQHKVTITKGFFMAVTEVTQSQYETIMGSNPSRFKGEDLPVQNISWFDADNFCKTLSNKEGKTYRLPTEAEWEYACRAGTTTPFYTGETINTEEVNYDSSSSYGKGKKGNYRAEITPVATFPPNNFGLYDMHGNILEWCQDWYGDNYYSQSPSHDPQGLNSGRERAVRGGAWNYTPWLCRSALRFGLTPDYNSLLGFRIVMEEN